MWLNWIRDHKKYQQIFLLQVENFKRLSLLALECDAVLVQSVAQGVAIRTPPAEN